MSYDIIEIIYPTIGWVPVIRREIISPLEIGPRDYKSEMPKIVPRYYSESPKERKVELTFTSNGRVMGITLTDLLKGNVKGLPVKLLNGKLRV